MSATPKTTRPRTAKIVLTSHPGRHGPKPVPYEVDWDSLAADGEALNFIDNVSCHRLNMALRVICQDDLGKNAIKDSLKKIKLKNVKDKAAMKLAFEGGVLEMHNDYAGHNYYSDNQIRELLIEKL